MHLQKASLGSMIFLLFVSCFFYAHVSATASVPRNDLRLELVLATGALDTSGNGRIVSLTGSSPSYITDSQYGVKHTNFSSSGMFKVNTSWGTTGTGDFTISFWLKLPSGNLTQNNSASIANLSQTIVDAQNVAYSKTYYDKPMVIFSTKVNQNDLSGLRLAINAEGGCSLNGDSRNISNYNPYGGWNGVGFYGDHISQNGVTFPCNFADGKWHNVVLVRKAGVLRTIIDNVQVYMAARTESIGRIVTIGGVGFWPNQTPYYNIYPSSVVNEIMNRSYYKGGILAFRLYSVGLSDESIESLYNEYSFIQGTLNGTGGITYNIESYSNRILSFVMSSVPNGYSLGSGYTYSYTINSGSSLPITDISEISSSTGTKTYRININLGDTPEGNQNINIRAINGSSVVSFGGLNFFKVDAQNAITINSPNTDSSPTKYISASVSNGGILSMSLTRGSTCNGSLIFEDYTDLTFTNMSDNGLKVCYKAIFPNQNNKTIYKISPLIQGIQSVESLLTAPNVKLFDNYTLWRKSSYQNASDSAMILLELLGVSGSASQGTINGVSIIDMNGDGLVDFVYSRNDTNRRAIITNNGNYTFKVSYKCAIDGGNAQYQGGPIIPFTYYGDCADPAR